MINLSEHLDDSRVINSRYEHGKEVGQECGLLLEIERESLVVTITRSARACGETKGTIDSHLDIRYADNHVFELVVLPSIRRTLDHSKSGVILKDWSSLYRVNKRETYEFVILDVQEDELGPEMRALSCFDNLIMSFSPVTYH